MAPSQPPPREESSISGIVRLSRGAQLINQNGRGCDTTAPTPTLLMLPGTVDVIGDGEAVTFTLGVTDDLTGILLFGQACPQAPQAQPHSAKHSRPAAVIFRRTNSISLTPFGNRNFFERPGGTCS
jgi:hypothetical protein